MNKYQIMFVVLTYRNTEDLTSFLESVKENVKDYRVIVVNSYYDDKSSKCLREIAIENKCDFIEVENKGYSYGNNVGIAYARDNYEFDYLIISNADILVKKLSKKDLDCLPKGIYGGKITNLKGKKQNPMIVKENPLVERLIYLGFKNNQSILIYLGILMNKFRRMLFWINRKIDACKVYQLHGSFLIFHSNVIKKWEKVFDENIFLFAEESCLAKRAKWEGIPMLFVPQVEVFHKEDGSVAFLGKKANERLKEANIYFYEKYCLGE